jgi:hypothetical protein
MTKKIMAKVKVFSDSWKIIVITIVFLTVLTSSCTRKITFHESAVVPAARGTVQVKSDKNNNYEINVKITDLAESSRLTPAKSMYIVWMLTDEDITKNIGQLKSSKSGFSSELKASFRTVSAFKPRKIFITAEDVADTPYPSNMTILSTDFLQL